MPCCAATSIAQRSANSARVSYYNCGDWVESCTALVEGDDGMIALVNYHSLSASGRAVAPTIDSARPKQTLVSN